ncbi:MAG TPA: apolipoprotein N-acyltransferase [Alphaproteobacteria bacterium]|nr:apolipoprotein N-acyltransferase [Alphaproteobacteria bacterium]
MTLLKNFETCRSALWGANFFLRLTLALLAGIGLSFMQAPHDMWFLMFPCLGLFYFLYAAAKNKKQVFATAFIFAIGYFVTGLNWIGNALLVEGNDYKWVWPLAVIALPTLLSLFTALYVTIAHILFPKNTPAGFLGFCVLLTISEYVRGYVFTGFPWNLYGYGWSSVLPMLQSLSLFGPYGLTFLTVIWGASLGYLACQSKSKIAVTSFVILSMITIYEFGVFRLVKASKEAVKGVLIEIVQPNIAQAEKWKSENIGTNFDKHIKLSAAYMNGEKNIYIWPETAMPPALLNMPAARERIATFLNNDGLLLTGALKVEENPTAYYNALIAWKNSDPPKHLYSKSHLVPFGEYIPFQKFIPIKAISGFSGFTKGKGPQTIEVEGYPSFSPLICYEVIFPNHAVNKSQPRPDYILTITNDAWYGDSPGPYQHFQHAKYRAIEQGIPVIRSANTGISGLADAYGRVISKINLMEEGSVVVPLPLKTPEKTYYSVHGDRLFIGTVLLCLLLALALRKKRFS